MSSWYSNLLTKTSSQISNLRTTLLASEADGDTEDDTHVCRVLRNYYGEKGRPFPPWLPPDPKAPAQAAPIQPLYAQSQGNRPSQPGASGMSSLWDTGAAQQQAAQQQAPQSLRVGRGGHGGAGVQRRPLPGDRAGSYQGPPASAPPAGASAQDRLRQRLWGSGGARTVSPGQTGQSAFPPPAGGSPYRR